MIRSIFRQYLTHLGMRSKAALTTPKILLELLLFGSMSIMFWPVGWSTPYSVVERPSPFDMGARLGIMWLMWLYMWPMVPALSCRGRATGGAACNPLATVGSPALPVSRGTRALAETTLVLLVAAGLRIVGLSAFGDGFSGFVVTTTISGALLMLPVTLSWALGARSLGLFMLRPLLLTIVITAAAAMGFTHSWPGVLGLTTALCWLVIRFGNPEIPDLARRVHSSKREDRSRPAKEPIVQLQHDTWAAPLETWAPWIGLTVVAYAAALVLDLQGMLWEWGFFAAFELFLIIVLQALFRPLGSNLAMEGLVGKHGAKRGDFRRAWSVLPVAPEAVLRRVWVHGLVFGLAIWAFPTFMLALRTWLSSGELGLRAADGGNLADLVLPAAAFVPMIAGFLVAASAGNKLQTAVSGLTLLLGVHTVLILRLVLHEMLGPDSMLAEVTVVTYFILLCAAASAPPLLLLRSERRNRIPQ